MLHSASMLRVRMAWWRWDVAEASFALSVSFERSCHVHVQRGDYFVVSGTRTQQKEFLEQLSKQSHRQAFCRTALNFRTDQDVNVSSTKLTRHAELIIHQLGLSCSSRSVSTPSEKSKPGVDLSSLVNSAHHTLYRSSMRLCYLELDRPDLQSHQKNWCKHGQLET